MKPGDCASPDLPCLGQSYTRGLTATDDVSTMDLRMATTVYIINGPNLNLLGKREPATYGRQTLEDLERTCMARGAELGLEVKCRQSNSEGGLVDAIQEAIGEGAAGIIINAAAYTHTSIAIHDALRAFDGAIIEVHLSNIHKRESFRHHSWISPVADGVIAGLGAHGYELALAAAQRLIAHRDNE